MTTPVQPSGSTVAEASSSTRSRTEDGSRPGARGVGRQPRRRDGAVDRGPRLDGRAWLHLVLIMLGGAALYLAHSLLRFRNYEAKGYDLGIFDQAVRQYALFREPISPIKGVDFNILGDHFHPILVVLAPLYWIWDDPRVLNVAMTVALVSCVVPIYLFARRRFSHGASLMAAAALLLWWPFQAMVNWDFHEITLGVPVMAWVIWALDARRHWLSVGLGSILLLVREDMGVTLLALALVLLIRRAWLPALVTAVLGVVGYYVATSVVIPHFSPAGEFGYWQFTALGPDLSSSVRFLLTQPLDAAAVLFDHPLKIALWLLHFVVLWLLPVLSPYTLLGLPILLSRLFNDRLNVWSPVYQYDAILGVIFLAAALETLARLQLWSVARARKRWGPEASSGSSTLVRAASASTHAVVPAARGRRLPAVFTGFVLGCAVVGTLLFPQVFPLQRTVTGQNWALPEHAQALERAVAQIPDDVCVEAADNAVPHLVDRTYVGLHGDMGDELATWMIIDTTVEELGGWDPLTPAQALERAERLGYAAVSEDDDGVWVLQRDRPVDGRCVGYAG